MTLVNLPDGAADELPIVLERINRACRIEQKLAAYSQLRQKGQCPMESVSEHILATISRLASLEEHTSAQDSDLNGRQGFESLLRRLIAHALAIVANTNPEFNSAVCWILGPISGEFTPIVFGKHERIEPLQVRSEHLVNFSLPPSHCRLSESHMSLLFGREGAPKSGELVSISSRGELLGFAAFCSPEVNNSSPIPNEVIVLLQRVIGDAVFNFRLQLLSSPLDITEEIDLHRYAASVADLVSLGMGADGAVIRFCSNDENNLSIAGQSGQLSEGADNHERFRREICRRVVESELHPYLAVTLKSRDVILETLGIQLSAKDARMLWDIGIRALLLHRIESRVGRGVKNRCLGVLAVYFRRTRQFSIRDVALFRSFCERIGDEASLILNRAELRRQRDNLELNVQLLEAASSVSSRAESIALLAHTLYHRARTVKEHAQMVESASLKAHSRGGSYSAVADRTRDLTKVIDELFRQIYQIRALSRRLEEPDCLFKISEVVDEICDIFKSVLSANDMDLVFSGDRELALTGNREVFRQVILNLTLNSIEAQRDTEKQRHNAISIRARREESGARPMLVLVFSDEGPGINRRVFPRPDEIFVIGKTSKKNGTGTGLPISRSLLYQMFSGEMRLVSAAPAVFELRVPMSE